PRGRSASSRLRFDMVSGLLPMSTYFLVLFDGAASSATARCPCCRSQSRRILTVSTDTLRSSASAARLSASFTSAGILTFSTSSRFIVVNVHYLCYNSKHDHRSLTCGFLRALRTLPRNGAPSNVQPRLVATRSRSGAQRSAAASCSHALSLTGCALTFARG